MSPRKRKTKIERLHQEGKIAVAIKALKGKEFTSELQASCAFKLPPSTLNDRMKGVPSKVDSHPPQCLLNETEEISLVKYVLHRDSLGFALTLDEIRKKANLIVAERGDDRPFLVGQGWPRRFVKRHPEVSLKRSIGYDMKRAKAENPKLIGEWFERVRETIVKYGIHEDDMYNVDETGFQMGTIGTEFVVTGSERRGSRRVLEPSNQEWVTSIECISAGGRVLNPLIIFKGKVHIKSWMEVLPFGWRISRSETGWTNNEISLIWLKNCFIPQTTTQSKGVHRLLIVDGHGSHTTSEFLKCCEENKIIPLKMPPHSSHLLQPLDVGCFSPLKKNYKKLIGENSRRGAGRVTKLDFLTEYPKARFLSFKLMTVKNSFLGSGLWPLDPEVVISQLDICVSTSTPTSSPERVWTPKTPTNSHEVDQQMASIKEIASNLSVTLPSPIKNQLTQFCKGFKLTLNSLQFERDEKKALQETLQKKRKNESLSRKRISNESDLSVEDIFPIFPETREAYEARIENSHNVSSESVGSPKQRTRKCGTCKNTGHTKRTCHLSKN